MPAEPTQELGRDGVAAIKRWLEATTHIELPFDAYSNPRYCVVPFAKGEKLFDLYGYFLGGDKDPIYVEGKRYSSASDLYPQFQEFLATAYASAAREAESQYPSRAHWIWVTYHPFALGRWKDLATEGEITTAVRAHSSIAPDGDVEPAIAREVAERTWVLVYNPKMESVTLTAAELKQVRTVVDRKGAGL